MAITVTDEMVQAARRKLPARWSMQDLADAIQAAIEAAPMPELVFDEGVELTPEQQAEWDRALAEATDGPLVRGFPPEFHPAPALGGITEIATHLGVARSTVVGWTKRAEKIGMPAPLAELAAGPVYDLTAVADWYRAWKNTDDATIAGNNGGR